MYSNHIANNIKILRKKGSFSQDELSAQLGIKRTSLSGYEVGSTEPNIELLAKLSQFFKVSIDQLINVDLQSLSELEFNQLINRTSTEIEGKNLRILATTVDANNNENVEMVTVAAKAGYTTGYADPDYIKVLPTFHLPFLSKNRKYRMFPIMGDSMPPVEQGSWVTGEYLQNWNFINNGSPYIIITKNDGIVFKVVYNQIAENGNLLLCSTNPIYEPYQVHVSEVFEIWKFVHYISHSLPEANLGNEAISSTLHQIQKDMAALKHKLL